MGIFSQKRERVDLEPSDDGKAQWVDLRRTLSVALQEAYLDAILLPAKDGERPDVRAAVYRRALLEAYVAEWEVYGEDGAKVPLSAPALAELPVEVAMVLETRIEAIRAEVRDEKKGSSRSTAASST